MKDGLKDHAEKMEKDMAQCSANLLKIVEKDRNDRIEADKRMENKLNNMENGMLAI